MDMDEDLEDNRKLVQRNAMIRAEGRRGVPLPAVLALQEAARRAATGRGGGGRGGRGSDRDLAIMAQMQQGNARNAMMFHELMMQGRNADRAAKLEQAQMKQRADQFAAEQRMKLTPWQTAQLGALEKQYETDGDFQKLQDGINHILSQGGNPGAPGTAGAVPTPPPATPSYKNFKQSQHDHINKIVKDNSDKGWKQQEKAIISIGRYLKSQGIPYHEAMEVLKHIDDETPLGSEWPWETRKWRLALNVAYLNMDPDRMESENDFDDRARKLGIYRPPKGSD
jgi:hypothetical protein